MSLEHSVSRAALMSSLAALLAVGGCARSSTSPSTPGSSTVTTRPVVTVTSVAIVGEQGVEGGYRYRTIVTLRESAGVAAPISAIDLTFTSGSATVVTSHHDNPVSDSSNSVPANGTVATRELSTTDADASHAYATSAQVRVTYADTATTSATTSAQASVPPLVNRPPATHTLTGVISDESGRGISGARVEATSGANAGKAATTDGSGGYSLSDLVAETFRLRASANGFTAGEQNVTVPANGRADFTLRRPAPEACAYTVTPGGVVDVGAYTNLQIAVTITRTSGTCGWQTSTNVGWLNLGSTSGNGSSTLSVGAAPNAAFVGRLGVVTVTWDGGSAQLSVRQAADMNVTCRITGFTVGGQSSVNVPAGGGQYQAILGVEAGVIPGACSSWSVSASPASAVSFSSTTGPTPGGVLITVQPNTSGAARTITITLTGNGTYTLTLNQAG